MSLRADGRHMVSQRVEGKRIYGYGQSDEEARADLKAKLTLSISEDENDFHVFAKTFWYPMIETLEPLSKHRYMSAYRTWIRPYFQGKDLCAFRFVDIQAWINWMKAQDKPAGDSTVRYVTILVSRIFEIACDLEIIPRNPCKSKQIVKPKKPSRRIRVMSPEKAAEVLEGVKGTDLSCPVLLALAYGPREGEIAALRWSDMSRIAQTLHIHRQFQQQKGKGLVEKDVKAGSRRILHLSKAIIEEIDKRGNLDSEFICTRGGNRWIPKTLYDDWCLIRGKLGLDNWTFHDLRHGAAGLLLATGSDIFQIASVLGHKNPDMSLNYTAREESAQRLGIENLSRRLLTQNPADNQ